jgi:hypothetical protein
MRSISGAIAGAPEPPVSGNRVKDNLIVLKDSGGVGHVVPKHIATFHLFNHNVMDKYKVNVSQQFFIPPPGEPFRVMTAAYSMPIDELIEQLDCIKLAGPTSFRSDIGLVEVFDLGQGWFQMGSKFCLDHPRSKLTIKEAWGSSIGEANESAPKWLVRIPGK